RTRLILRARRTSDVGGRPPARLDPSGTAPPYPGSSHAHRGHVECDLACMWETGLVTEDVLRQAPLFNGLDEDASGALEASMSTVTLRRGEILFAEGDEGDQLYVVIEGKIKLGRRSIDGRENLIAILGPGQMFGELSFFDPGPRSATATAVTDVQLKSLSHTALQPTIEKHPAVAGALLNQLAGRLRRTHEVVGALVFSA